MAQAIHVLFGQGRKAIPAVVQATQHVVFGGGLKRVLEVLTNVEQGVSQHISWGVGKVQEQLRHEAAVGREEMQKLSRSASKMSDNIADFLRPETEKPQPLMRRVTIDAPGVDASRQFGSALHVASEPASFQSAAVREKRSSQHTRVTRPMPSDGTSAEEPDSVRKHRKAVPPDNLPPAKTIHRD